MYQLYCRLSIQTKFEEKAKEALEELKKVLKTELNNLYFEKHRSFDEACDVTFEMDIFSHNFSEAIYKTLNMCFQISDKWYSNYSIYSEEPELTLIASAQTLAKFYIKYINWVNFELKIKIDYDLLPIKLEDRVKVLENEETLKEGINNLLGKINSYPKKAITIYGILVFFLMKKVNVIGFLKMM
jgi:hypothetical protein